MKIETYGWGRYPRTLAEISAPSTPSESQHTIAKESFSSVPRGMGRSYGDSALSEHIISTRLMDRFIAFDRKTGEICCDAGVTLAEILKIIVPHGWFLPVTPGTSFVTLGGAIASDVHGKNHHSEGAFSQHINYIDILLGNGEMVRTSPDLEPELFRATCGGMGLTGLVLSACIRLKKIMTSQIDQTIIKAPNLSSVMKAFEANKQANYSVAWIDCLSTGKNLGRSLLMLGEHSSEGPLILPSLKIKSMPFDMPAGLLNSFTVSAFNTLYYHRITQNRQQRVVHYHPYFYPLDRLGNWNRLYGKTGFLQYQFVIPQSAGEQGMREIIGRIANSGKGSFLAVLKQFGPASDNYLSFPIEGYTLALDFKAEPAAFDLLDTLDKMVLSYGGRVYLTKDARMTEEVFKSGYPQWEKFEQVRMNYHAQGKFNSMQSKRLGLR